MLHAMLSKFKTWWKATLFGLLNRNMYEISTWTNEYQFPGCVLLNVTFAVFTVTCIPVYKYIQKQVKPGLRVECPPALQCSGSCRWPDSRFTQWWTAGFWQSKRMVAVRPVFCVYVGVPSLHQAEKQSSTMTPKTAVANHPAFNAGPAVRGVCYSLTLPRGEWALCQSCWRTASMSLPDLNLQSKKRERWSRHTHTNTHKHAHIDI